MLGIWAFHDSTCGINGGLCGAISIVQVCIGQALPKAGSQHRRQCLPADQHMPQRCAAVKLRLLQIYDP